MLEYGFSVCSIFPHKKFCPYIVLPLNPYSTIFYDELMEIIMMMKLPKIIKKMITINAIVRF